MTHLKLGREKKLMKNFLKEVTKTEGSLAVYGEPQVRKALEMGVVDTLILSENLRKYRVKLKCSSCNYSEEQTISDDQIKEFEPPICSKCNSSSQKPLNKTSAFLLTKTKTPK